MTRSQLTEQKSSECTSAEASGNDLGWQQILPDEKFLLNKVVWILYGSWFCLNLLVCKSGCFCRLPGDIFWWLPVGHFCEFRCTWHPPLHHLLFSVLWRWKPECSGASPFFFQLWNFLTERCGIWGPLCLHKRLDTLFVCTRNENVWMRSRLREDMLSCLILLGYFICKERAQCFMVLQFLVHISYFDRGSLSLR